jgi:hypothetical protein
MHLHFTAHTSQRPTLSGGGARDQLTSAVSATLEPVKSYVVFLSCYLIRTNFKVHNVPPYVASHPPSRARFIVQSLKVSNSQIYKDIVDLLLFYSHSSLRTPVLNKNYRSIGYTIGRFVNAISRGFFCSPLLNPDFRGLSEIRSTEKESLIRENLAICLKGYFNPRKMSGFDRPQHILAPLRVH